MGASTVSVNEHWLLLPLESTAVQVINWLPGPNTLPEGGLHVTATELPQLSAADGVVKLTTPSQTVPFPRLQGFTSLKIPVQFDV